MPPPPVRPGPHLSLGPHPLSSFLLAAALGQGGHGSAPPPGLSPSHHGSQRHFVRLSRNTLSHLRKSRPAPELHSAPPVGTCPTGVTCLVSALSSHQGRGLPRRLRLICLIRRRLRFIPWVGKILWRRKWQPTPVFLPGKSHGWRSLAGSPWGPKESD